MKKVFLTRPLPEEVQVALEGFDVTVRPKTTPLSKPEMLAVLRDYDGAIPTLGDLFSDEIFTEVPSPRCQILANFGVGYNHLDVSAAKRAGVTVTNTPGAVTDATADVAMTLMLMSARRAGEGERLVRSGGWEGWHPTQMLGLHLSGKTVGIVGMGRIGQAIARRCLGGFGMSVHYFGRSQKTLDFDAVYYNDLKSMVGSVDVVVLAVPGGAETRHLINADILGAMKPHAHLINISRGDVIDEAALTAVLQDRAIGGAGLDVYEHEPNVPAALRDLENVVLLPHLGTAALEVRVDMGLMAVENLKAFFDGQEPPNRV